MTVSARRKGRPRKRQPKPGERVPLGLRVTPSLKKALDLSAAQSGRSQSQEAEFRLERSFHDQSLLDMALELAYGPESAAILAMIGEVMKIAGRGTAFAATSTLEGSQRWWDNPYAYDQVAKGIAATLELLRPTGEIELPRTAKLKGGPPKLDFEVTYKRYGEGIAIGLSQPIAFPGSTASMTDERMSYLRKALGPPLVGESKIGSKAH